MSYELIPQHNISDLLDPDDYPRRRAGFADYQLWVTPYTREQAAAGIYPNQSRGGEGLPAWTKSNRSIGNTDLVVWYTLGFHHAPVSEDWPVLPTMWHEFYLRPRGFFSRSPVIDLPDPNRRWANSEVDSVAPPIEAVDFLGHLLCHPDQVSMARDDKHSCLGHRKSTSSIIRWRNLSSRRHSTSASRNTPISSQV